ncbi:beta-lactamase family protein [Ophiobolus disseminans]|uniref:Beta-lactamase family protein n=1 Tax=Ophiobolus disseminans TaxID=1469910 RepID=A0A6A7AEB0_9PLEO|nr:beta-lactamase family protein [Ophiobolus disseminans]
MSPIFSPSTASTLRTYIDNATNPTLSSQPLPGALVHIVDAKNNVLFSHGSSTSSPPPTATSISIVQSLTKLVGAIAFMQLVDRGLASLDDASIVPAHLPELAAQKVLTGYTVTANGGKKWTFEERRGNITPRMLLNHTYGGGHTYFNTLLFEYFQDKGMWDDVNEAADTYNTILESPLLWHPGTRTNYGQGLDWIAVLIERLTGQALASYLQENVFAPLGMSSTGFEPGFGGAVLEKPGKEDKFWPRVLRTSEGITTLDALKPEKKERDDAFPTGAYHTGRLGTGLISSAADYTRLLTLFLPEDTTTNTQTQPILTPSSLHEITFPSLPPSLRNSSRHIPNSGASPIILPTDLSAAHIDPAGSYGLGGGVQGADRILADGRKGRSMGSLYWYGAANTEYWVDVQSGIVVYVNGNHYPWNEEVWMGFVAGVEGTVYEGLEG